MGGEEKGQKEESFPLFSFFLLLEFCAEVFFFFSFLSFEIEKEKEMKVELESVKRGTIIAFIALLIFIQKTNMKKTFLGRQARSTDCRRLSFFVEFFCLYSNFYTPQRLLKLLVKLTLL